jgi:hypothetical protein
MIIEIAAFPPAAVDEERSPPAARILAGCPTFTYAPTNHKHVEHAIEEIMTGRRRPTISIKAT